MANINLPVPGADQYYPLNEPSIGVAFGEVLDLPANRPF
jgi:hypothetical protein